MLFLSSQFTAFTGEGCRWLGCKVREKGERFKKKGSRILRARNHHHHKFHHHHKIKNRSSSENKSCDNDNNTSCTWCVGPSDDHPSVPVKSEPVNVVEEGEEYLKPEATVVLQNQSTPGYEDVMLSSEGTSMAASVGSDDCNSSLSNASTSSSSWVGGGASPVKKSNVLRSPMVRFVADVTIPDLTTFSPGKQLRETKILASFTHVIPIVYFSHELTIPPSILLGSTGERFVKTWHLRNDGPGTVPEDSRLVWCVLNAQIKFICCFYSSMYIPLLRPYIITFQLLSWAARSF